MNFFTRFVYTLIILLFILGNANLLLSQTLVIDNFNKEYTSVGKKYPNYINTQVGYDVYYSGGVLRLSRTPISPDNKCDKVLRLDFTLPSYGWMSVRREFESSINLADYKGLIFNLKVDTPAPNTTLRITLSDSSDGKTNGDEMWWFDCERALLDNESQQWIEVNIPFDDFIVSYGNGTRHNDYKMNLSGIVAYEINLVSDSNNERTGVIYIDYIRAYK